MLSCIDFFHYELSMDIFPTKTFFEVFVKGNLWMLSLAPIDLRYYVPSPDIFSWLGLYSKQLIPSIIAVAVIFLPKSSANTAHVTRLGQVFSFVWNYKNKTNAIIRSWSATEKLEFGAIPAVMVLLISWMIFGLGHVSLEYLVTVCNRAHISLIAFQENESITILRS